MFVDEDEIIERGKKYTDSEIQELKETLKIIIKRQKENDFELMEIKNDIKKEVKEEYQAKRKEESTFINDIFEIQQMMNERIKEIEEKISSYDEFKEDVEDLNRGYEFIRERIWKIIPREDSTEIKVLNELRNGCNYETIGKKLNMSMGNITYYKKKLQSKGLI